MNICIFGESCVGKSTLAKKLQARTGATVYTGKDYLRLAKNEADATAKFRTLLQEEDNIIYVTTEPSELSLLPDNCLRILMTEELDVIKERFAQRMRGHLPAPVETMLEKKHGIFDAMPHDLHFHGANADIDLILSR